MPKIKKGLDYFDIETDINNDMRIKLLRAEFGIKGFGIWVQLLIQIYSDEGYFMKWDKDTKLLFANDVGESGGLVDEVVKGSVKRGLFDESVFNQFGVLTSKHIQEKYFNAIKRRSTETPVNAEYLLDVNIIAGNDNIKLLNVNKKKQSKGEKRKGKESKEKYCCGDSEVWGIDQPIDYVSFVDAFNDLYDRSLRVTDTKRKQIRARLRTFTGEEVLQAWENRKGNDWLNGEGKKYLGDWKAAMRNDEKIEQYLNQDNNGREDRNANTGGSEEEYYRDAIEEFESSGVAGG